METPGYTTLTRQSGLMREMQVVANNIANISTAGYRREGVVFSEFVRKLAPEASLSMAHGNTRHIDLRQGGLAQTGGTYDLAIQGEGFFLIETPTGQKLSRSGIFTLSEEGILVNPDGFSVLDEGGAAIALPNGAQNVSIGKDGTISANGTPVAKLGLWQPVDPVSLRHQSGTLFAATELEPAETTHILQGFTEESNVAPLAEIARMIEVQRSYEQGQKFLDAEDLRQKTVIQTLGR